MTTAITPKVRRAVRALRTAIQTGEYKAIESLTPAELSEAAKVMEEQAAIAEKIRAITVRCGLKPKRNDKVSTILKRAAMAGDQEAKELLDSGFLFSEPV